MIIDIPRERSPEVGITVAKSVVEQYGDGVIALGLGGPERGNPPSKFRTAFNRVREAGIPCILHAGETEGPSSVWNAIEVADSKRIGHGVRSIEDPRLMAHLKLTQLPLEVCPTSNVCLNVYPSLAQHSLPKLLEYGLRVTINSDDPPMFNTSLVGEFLACCKEFGWDKEVVQRLLLNAIDVTLLPPPEKLEMRQNFLNHLADQSPGMT
jgi:aminodeoxyfutalosine deaminase